jgi:hypothetical protein
MVDRPEAKERTAPMSLPLAERYPLDIRTLRQSAFDNVDEIHDAVALCHACTMCSIDSDGVNFVNVTQSAVLFGKSTRSLRFVSERLRKLTGKIFNINEGAIAALFL